MLIVHKGFHENCWEIEVIGWTTDYRETSQKKWFNYRITLNFGFNYSSVPLCIQIITRVTACPHFQWNIDSDDVIQCEWSWYSYTYYINIIEIISLSTIDVFIIALWNLLRIAVRGLLRELLGRLFRGLHWRFCIKRLTDLKRTPSSIPRSSPNRFPNSFSSSFSTFYHKNINRC